VVPVERNADLAIAIAWQLGVESLAIRPITGQGEVNRVFIVDTGDGEWVIRFSRYPRDTDDYSKEAFCLREALRHGVPSPQFIAAGRCQDVPYIVQTLVPGPNADRRRSAELWEMLGRYARVVHSIPLDGSAPVSLFPRFGRDLAANWRMHVDYNIAEMTSEDPLLGLGVYGLAQQEAIRSLFAPLRHWSGCHGLAHGDLGPRNVLLPPDHPPVLLDWGNAATGPAPHTDLVALLTDHRRFGDPLMVEIASFAAGCGVDLAEELPTVEDMLLLHRFDQVRWALDIRPDRVPAKADLAREAVRRRFPV
jgi:aminoglycoside phosphotransferase (APT) family kinase protein